MDTRDFLVPDDYADFSCKCGKCRHTCCDGWAVTFPREDYFRLLSVPCSPELRRKLDTSLHLADDSTPERYAELLPNWEGHCPLQRADGLCALQAECGEEAISSTCRYYPRGIRTMDDDECACSASCERVVEMLLHRQAPMTFRRMRLSFAMPLPPRETDAALTAETRQLRRDVVTMLQAREVPLASRMMGIRAALVLEESGHQTSESRWAAFRAAAKVAIPPADWALRANILRTLMEEQLADTISMGGIAAEILPLLRGEQAGAVLQQAAGTFQADTPDWMIGTEQLMVNHVFYEGFPYGAHQERPATAAVSLCAEYAVLRGTAVLYHQLHPDEKALVDAIAALFRVMEHSAFGWNAAVVLEREGKAGEDVIGQIVGI